MSEQESFLVRWARRKGERARDGAQAGAEPGPPVTASERAAGLGEDAAAKPCASDTADAIGPPPAAAPLLDLNSLPPIETITAGTDIRAFLSPGVPGDLARAALRRAWVADTQIRDFVGLAEYAWDYHAPGAMLGFGPLEMTDDLRRLVDRIVGGAAGEPRLPAQPPVLQPVQEENSNSFKSQESTRPDPDAALDGIAQDSVTNNTADPAINDESAPRRDRIAAVQHEAPEPEQLQCIARRSHGGAMPT